MKVKNKKSNLADTFINRRNKTTTKKSPFEIHINRTKQHVLGRKSKADRGLPGVSRSKAIAKRKQTLLQEFKVKDKDNLFYDKRIGAKSKTMTEEEKTMRRFVAERISRHKKSSIFNLNDEEILTHKGQSLMEIERYENPRSDDEDSGEDSGRLDGLFVDEAHFGGGLFERKSQDKMSHKDLIDTLILESKKRKAEKKRMKEETMDLTDKLDAQWKDLLPLMAAAEKTHEDKERERGKVDDYDKLVKQMKVDRRAVAGEKLKSQEDIDKEERSKIEKLEKERLLRMEDEEDRKQAKRHKSADDLDFDYLIEEVDEEVEDEDKEEDEKDDESDKEEQDDENDERDDEEEDENEDENESEPEDDLADLKESSGSEEEEETKNDKGEKKIKTDEKTRDERGKEKIEEEKEEQREVKHIPEINNIIDDKSKESAVEKLESEISCPSSNAKFKNLQKTYPMIFDVKDLEKVVSKLDLEQKAEVISRMIKGNEKSPGYREQFGQLFGCLLQYLDTHTNVKTEKELSDLFKMCDVICPNLYNLAHVNPEETCVAFKNFLKTKHEAFETDMKSYPRLDTIILFKVAALIYPSSDFRHPVMTPCHIFMTEILLRSKVQTRTDLAKGLFICTLLLENTLLSKRFAPSVINFLRGILYSSLPKDNNFTKLRAIRPFKSLGAERNFLVLENSFKNKSVDKTNLKMQLLDLIEDDINDDFKIRLVATMIGLLNEFIDLLENLEAAYALFKPFEEILNLDVLNNYPEEVRKEREEVKDKLKKIMNKELEYLVLPKKKPKSLKLYEPKIEPVYEGKRNRPESRELAERQKLIHKLKMESKNAKREIRRDNAFLSKVRIKEQIRSDEERKRKVRELFADAAIQQSELKKWKK